MDLEAWHRLPLALSSRKSKGNYKNIPTDFAELTRSLHIWASHSSRRFVSTPRRSGWLVGNTDISTGSTKFPVCQSPAIQCKRQCSFQLFTRGVTRDSSSPSSLFRRFYFFW
jgi:hypothetical protein